MFLQLRMSKKIAQLTKVIYHLNTKSEDHDLDLQEMAEHYEAEIESILRSATGRTVIHRGRARAQFPRMCADNNNSEPPLVSLAV